MLDGRFQLLNTYMSSEDGAWKLSVAARDYTKNLYILPLHIGSDNMNTLRN